MLQNLYVKDLALIDEADVAFESGLNILSGETGAGKSIIIGSINLALGAKVPKDIVRKNAESAYVELVFQIEDTRTQKILEENGIRLEDNQLIIGRRISSSRSICKINGESVPASKIKEISHLLIDIHGQHEHQSLLYKSKHLEILDAFAKSRLNTIKQNVSKIYRRYVSLRKELEEFNKDEEQRRREMSFLEFEVNEIESANLVANEEGKLDEQHRLLSHGKQIVDGLNEIIYE
ncbi:MAG: AAA family ATPase, partial [Lachnospiraceae bacterium]